MTPLILAIDPGNVTGVAIRANDGTVATGEYPHGLDGIVDFLVEYKATLPSLPDLIVVEDFIIRHDTHKKTREPAAYEGVGFIKGWARMHGIPVQLVGPAEHKSFNGKGRRSKVQQLGWAEKTKDGHAEDAASLLLLGLVRNYRPIAADLLRDIAEEA